MFKWLWRLLGGTSEITTQPQSVGQTGVDNQVRKTVVRNRRAVPAKKAILALSPQEYAATTRAKRAGKAQGKQFVPQPAKVKAKVKPYRKVK